MKKGIILSIILLSTSLSAQKNKMDYDSNAVAKIFNGRAGAFEVLTMRTKKYFRYNVARCAERFLSASTFKIPNSLIGLETKVIEDENYVIKWDGVNRWNKEWNRDHTLSSAIKYSVVPYYQELARRVGPEQYKKWLDTISYGNQVIGDRIDTFWLDNSLKISADEQIAFLKRFYNEEIPISKRAIDIVKKIMSEEKHKHSILKFKTGTGTKEDGTYIGWLVGYVEKEENVYLFAFNIEAKTFEQVRKLRDDKSRLILKKLKVLE